MIFVKQLIRIWKENIKEIYERIVEIRINSRRRM